jgi:serine protease Do
MKASNVTTITEDMAKQYNSTAGVRIDSVVSGSAAEAAGLKPGDIILEIDSTKVSTNDALINEITKHKVGDPVSFKVWRNGSTSTITATLGENKGSTN